MSKHKLIFAALALALLLSARSAFSQDSQTSAAKPAAGQDFQAPSDDEINMLRKDLRSQKKQLIAANMPLSDKEAEKFWPVYDQYTAELVKINDTKYSLIKEYAQSYSTMTDAQADGFIPRWLGVDKSVADLRTQYVPKFRAVLSAKKTALFYQLDRRVGMMIDLQLASQLPLVQP
jgi:hypothetical protein